MAVVSCGLQFGAPRFLLVFAFLSALFLAPAVSFSLSVLHSQSLAPPLFARLHPTLLPTEPTGAHAPARTYDRPRNFVTTTQPHSLLAGVQHEQKSPDLRGLALLSFPTLPSSLDRSFITRPCPISASPRDSQPSLDPCFVPPPTTSVLLSLRLPPLPALPFGRSCFPPSFPL